MQCFSSYGNELMHVSAYMKSYEWRKSKMKKDEKKKIWKEPPHRYANKDPEDHNKIYITHDHVHDVWQAVYTHCMQR